MLVSQKSRLDMAPRHQKREVTVCAMESLEGVVVMLR